MAFNKSKVAKAATDKALPKASKTNTGSTRLTTEPNCSSWTVDREADRRLMRDMKKDLALQPTWKATPGSRASEDVGDPEKNGSKSVRTGSPSGTSDGKFRFSREGTYSEPRRGSSVAKGDRNKKW